MKLQSEIYWSDVYEDIIVELFIPIEDTNDVHRVGLSGSVFMSLADHVLQEIKKIRNERAATP